jgi:CRP/FNR family transcriptional regulator, nitrogen fixation regulation protein
VSASPEIRCVPPPGVRPDPLDSFGPLALTRRCRRGQRIYDAGDPATHWYRLGSGLGRKFALRPGGRRQIVDLLLSGDFFGFTARAEHPFAAEAALEGTVVTAWPRRQLERLADSDPRLGARIRELTIESLSRLQARALALGRASALEKVGGFLVEMHERTRRGPGDPVVLTMSRYDIADYLALSVETVSRALTELRRRGAITPSTPHCMTILDCSALRGFGAGARPATR